MICDAKVVDRLPLVRGRHVQDCNPPFFATNFVARLDLAERRPPFPLHVKWVFLGGSDRLRFRDSVPPAAFEAVLVAGFQVAFVGPALVFHEYPLLPLAAFGWRSVRLAG